MELNILFILQVERTNRANRARLNLRIKEQRKPSKSEMERKGGFSKRIGFAVKWSLIVPSPILDELPSPTFDELPCSVNASSPIFIVLILKAYALQSHRNVRYY